MDMDIQAQRQDINDLTRNALAFLFLYLIENIMFRD